ncbi:deoxyribodipyrimidine photo-lyase [Agarivorans sp.]|uniref:deoxyribodipyrimidine photo-lyase n=1 Tax=Agarivorans sp. TaxID=1872412 RepID=UPI003CFF5262
MQHQLVWFRNDLRVRDNQALSQAVASKQAVLAVYLACPQQWQSHDLAPIQADLIERRLATLQQQLAELNIPLLVVHCPDFASVPQCFLQLAQQYHIGAVHFQQQYELNEQRRDQAVQQSLSQQGLEVFSYHGDCILPPASVLTKTAQVFKVFTPFRKAWLGQLDDACFSPLAAPAAVLASLVPDSFKPLLAQPEPVKLDYPTQDSSAWLCDEHQVIQCLRDFSAAKAESYQQLRDFPAEAGTSKLSAYLALGIISPRQCLARLYHDHPQVLESQQGGAFVWLSEIVWREFYRHLIAAYPQLCKGRAFLEWTERVSWQHDEQLLQAWQQGKTGYPIVDAAMRQLAETGWMHNRLRMIVASFLSKDLLIDWHHGERWFMQHLIDGDFASNNGGWQWAASTGTDAQPYFRIFNPTTQGERFDPSGEFVRHWLPELSEVPGKKVHQAHTWAEKHAVHLAYPKPIVDHAKQRKLALSLFEQAKANYGAVEPLS